MGMEAPSGDKMVAHVLCNGGCNAKENFEYRGVKDCLAATKVCGGDAKACKYGCFGFGSCVAACKFDAIHVENGVAVVDKEKCTNCAVLGVALLNTQNDYNFIASVVYGITGGLGCLLAIFLFAAVREQLEVSSENPKAFDGFHIALVTAGLMALAFMGFSGLKVW